MDLITLDDVDKREPTYFEEVFTPEKQTWVLDYLKSSFAASEALWPVVWQEVLIAIWLNCPEHYIIPVAEDVTRRWLAAEKKRQQRAKQRQVGLDVEAELPNLEHDSWDLEPYLELLTQQQQVVVTLRYEHGMTEQEIADHLEISQPAVSGMLKRAKKTIREKINEG